MIKVLHILTDTNIGGAGVWLLNFLGSYDREELDVSVALPENALLAEKIAALDVPIHTVKYIADASFSKGAVGEFKKLFEELKPDIVHTHACLSARIAAKQCGIKTVNTRHCFEPKKSFPKSIVYKLINNALSDRVIGVSEAIAENLKQDGIKPSMVRLVYNGSYPLTERTAEADNAVRERYGIPNDAPVVGIVARLEPVKNVELFVEAAAVIKARRPDARFIIVGVGSSEASVRARADDLGIADIITLAGYSSDVGELVSLFDVSVLTSREEALSLSLIEAMSLSKPCVSTDSVGPREVISDGESGFITENHNSEALAEKILLLLSDADMRRRFGEVGKRIAYEKFSVTKMAEELLKIYKELIPTEVVK